MKRIIIEQVDNGYIASNKPEFRGECSAIVEEGDSGIHVFETFASMSKWLEGHFEPVKAPRPAPLPLGNNDDF